MKTRFNSFDIVCAVTELQKVVGLRVNQIYDVDNKTYLIRLQGTQEKSMLLIESGSRFHTTEFEWPKNNAPSGFSMKLRKHLKNKRLEKVQQLEADRIVDLEFGAKEAAYHVFLELYDRGNIVLTDHEYTILYVLRPHTEGEEIRFAVREKYPLSRAKKPTPQPTDESLREFLKSVKSGEYLRRALMPLLDCGPAVMEHVLIKYGLSNCVVKNEDSNEPVPETEVKQKRKQKKWTSSPNDKTFDVEKDMPQLLLAIQESNDMLCKARSAVSEGYIIQKKGEVLSADGESEKVFYQNIEYHPFQFAQFNEQPIAKFNTFLRAVDEFYSKLEGQKIDLKTVQQEREAIKKLTNVKKDHMMRLEELSKTQEVDRKKAEIITANQQLVDNAILAVRSLIANQISWPNIRELVKAAQANGDPAAKVINQLKLETNQISLKLLNKNYLDDIDDESEDDEKSPEYVLIDIDLSMTAWANARRYYDQKRMAAKKEQKTINASEKALKNAEWKTQQTLKDVRTISNIVKARKVYWFEKFYWFISSENYLVIGGRDAQQNELIVKRYMRPSDIYVHAEIQGASSVVIRNPTENEVPPKTLLEAGTMALSYSVAWDAKVVTNVYWVNSDQVSKKAPTGEYLGTGSFMIRGKKNFLPSCNLIMGLSLLFKLEDSFIDKHRGERKVRMFDDEREDQIDQQFKTQLQIEQIPEKKEIEDSCEQEIETNQQSSKEDTDSSENETEEPSQFPDTQVKIEHDTGHITIKNDAHSLDKSSQDSSSGPLKAVKLIVDNEDTTIISAAPARRKQQQNAKKRKEEKERKSAELKAQQEKDIMEQNNSNKAKRGQRGKLKKLKSKYKDQDEEERQLRMNLLKSFGKGEMATSTDLHAESETVSSKAPLPKEQKKQRETQQNQEDDDVDDLAPADADVEMLDSLTGQPDDEDELLFVIPVVAPYQALQNYKYKVKLIPGTGKRGKAAKTSLLMFSKDKLCSLREKDLLKSIKEDMLARNIPGKVKITAPQLQKFKK